MKNVIRQTKNAMNRTLTKTRKNQVARLVEITGLKAKTIRHYKRNVRARNEDLSVKIFTTKKKITPFMYNVAPSGKSAIIFSKPSQNVSFAIAKSKTGGKFLINSKSASSKGFKTRYSAIRSSYKTKKSGRKYTRRRTYYYLAGETRLSELSLKDANKAHEDFKNIFAEELKN